MPRWSIAAANRTDPALSEDAPGSKARYHHGDLRQALIDSAAGLVQEKGPAGFSLREVARRAGVSHAAPAHHFRSTKGLLTAVASEGFEALTAAMAEAVEGLDDPAERLSALGRAYVGISAEYPGHVAVMFRSDIVDHDDEYFNACGLESYAELEKTIDLLRDVYNPELDTELAGKFVWSTIQGLVSLSADFGPLDEKREVKTRELTQMIDGFVQLMLDGCRARD